jgi:DNA-binding NarL/FixJ family response regulator
MRATRLIYIENDPALRSILGKLLGGSSELDLVGSFGNSNDVLNANFASKPDVALIDFALDSNGLNGVELGIALRNIYEYMGIVIYSQFPVRPMVRRVPKEMRSGWSFIEKSALFEVEDYVHILKGTVSGKGNWEEIIIQNTDDQESENSLFFTLTPRQRLVMSLTSQGKGAQDIASQLGLSYSYVRKELSRAYSVLVPNPKPGDDLKTAAVLQYMELTRLS